MPEPIRVLVHGAQGKMGQEVLNALCYDADVMPVSAVDSGVGETQLCLSNGSIIPLSSNLEAIMDVSCPDVVVDFTLAEATMPAVRIAAQRKVGLVIGTTGLSSEDLAEIDQITKLNELGAIVAPNFALGAVVMMYLSKVAAKFFDWAEIIEMHHERKVDAPSGTAISTAKAMVESRGEPFLHCGAIKETVAGSRGGEIGGVAMHSVRLPGQLAHQEVILGISGQTLRIRHDTINRECYMPGVLLAIKRVGELRGLTYGLDTLLGL